MPQLSQANRPLRIDTPLGEDALLLASFTGTEAVSAPFSFHLDLYSEQADIDPEKLLRQPVVLRIRTADDDERLIHGLVRRFTQLGQIEDVTAYKAEVVPWLWFLSLARDCRIFQDLDVLEIVEKVFKTQGYSDFDVRCTRHYPKREYCVQYRETNLNFVSRLMEEEGIFYFFEHSDSKHVLVLADDNNAIKPCPHQPDARLHPQEIASEDVITVFEREHVVQSGKVTLADYDYLQPSLSLKSSVANQEPEEIYDYPGLALDLHKVEVEQLDRLARLRLEEREARRQIVTGEGNCRGFQTGGRFNLKGHYRQDINQTYMLLEVRHLAHSGDVRSWDTAPFEYRVHFSAIPYDVPFRPPQKTLKPVVRGSQTALVVGKSGEEVWVDKYGRIKIHFYWDREGSKDENASCWVRVATPWGGKGWGAITMPRIGNEVVVDFLEGDPDRPLVTGSVYNAEQTVPFTLPGAGIQMGMKSRSSPGGGGYNEITMTDTKGKEQMTIHAQYNRSARIENDDSTSVGNDRSVSVTGKCTNTTKKDHTLTVTDGNYTHNVNTGKADITVKKDVTLKSTAGAIAQTAKNDFSITSGTKAVSIDGSTEITIKVGSSSIHMKKDGTITIKGKNITIDASDGAIVQGKTVNVSGGQEAKIGVGSNQMTCDVAKVNVSGAAINASAVGTHEIAGAVVKIN
jgi:type VI secretion system secreted protein VgrG